MDASGKAGDNVNYMSLNDFPPVSDGQDPKTTRRPGLVQTVAHEALSALTGRRRSNAVTSSTATHVEVNSKGEQGTVERTSEVAFGGMSPMQSVQSGGSPPPPKDVHRDRLTASEIQKVMSSWKQVDSKPVSLQNIRQAPTMNSEEAGDAVKDKPLGHGIVRYSANAKGVCFTTNLVGGEDKKAVLSSFVLLKDSELNTPAELLNIPLNLQGENPKIETLTKEKAQEGLQFGESRLFIDQETNQFTFVLNEKGNISFKEMTGPESIHQQIKEFKSSARPSRIGDPAKYAPGARQALNSGPAITSTDSGPTATTSGAIVHTMNTAQAQEEIEHKEDGQGILRLSPTTGEVLFVTNMSFADPVNPEIILMQFNLGTSDGSEKSLNMINVPVNLRGASPAIKPQSQYEAFKATKNIGESVLFRDRDDQGALKVAVKVEDEGGPRLAMADFDPEIPLYQQIDSLLSPRNQQ